VKQLSDRAIFLLNGRIEAQGEPKDVINRYVGLVLERTRSEEAPRRDTKGSYRHGDHTSEIKSIKLLNAAGEEASVFRAGECVRVAIESVFHRAQSDPMVGILIRTRIGMDVYGTNSRLECVELGDFDAGDRLSVEFRFECWLAPQEYTLTVAMQHPDGLSHDWVDDAVAFRVIDDVSRAGVTNLRATLRVTRPE
jgi:lipopolysaccharide transport system ATP-binding protein